MAFPNVCCTDQNQKSEFPGPEGIQLRGTGIGGIKQILFQKSLGWKTFQWDGFTLKDGEKEWESVLRKQFFSSLWIDPSGRSYDYHLSQSEVQGLNKNSKKLTKNIILLLGKNYIHCLCFDLNYLDQLSIPNLLSDSLISLSGECSFCKPFCQIVWAWVRLRDGTRSLTAILHVLMNLSTLLLVLPTL